MLKLLAHITTSLLFPLDCETCGKSLSLSDRGICASCSNQISWIKAPFCSICSRPLTLNLSKCADCHHEHFYFRKAWAAARYEGKMKELLQAYKFSKRKSLHSFLGEALSKHFSTCMKNERFDFILPVPLPAEREKERGFNQARLLSSYLSSSLGISHAPQFLKRNKSAQAQSLLTKKGRRINIRGCFYVENSPFSGKDLLLIDDILTTGQTASECSKVLLEAGAKSVSVLACARGVKN